MSLQLQRGAGLMQELIQQEARRSRRVAGALLVQMLGWRNGEQPAAPRLQGVHNG